MAKETAKTPVVDLDDKQEVRKQIRQLKAGQRVRIQRGGYSLTVGVPLAEQSVEEPQKIKSDGSGWFE